MSCLINRHHSWLVVNPSMSPEKAFETVGGEDISTNLGTTMDNSVWLIYLAGCSLSL
jgi:hypothetical protein